MKVLLARGGLARLFAGAVANQALLSATSFIVGLIMIRRSTDTQYGYYVLITAAVPMLSQLQAAFFFPAMASRITRVGREERGAFVGAIFGLQRRLLVVGGLAAIAATALLWGLGVLTDAVALIVFCAVLAAAANLFREFFRGALQGYRRPYDVLRADVVYALMLVAGAFLATQTRAPAAAAAGVLAFAGACGGVLLAGSLWRHESWSKADGFAVLREIGVLGAWAAVGSAIHWTFTQGYSYLVAATLDVAAVAGIAATRLMLMPVVLFSIGITTLMMPTASLWLQQHGLKGLLRRLSLLSAGMAAATVFYAALLWLCRDWIFLHVLKRDFPHRDTLLLLWSATFLSIVVRDQLIFLLIAQSRFRTLAGLTFACAVFGLLVSYFSMRNFGAVGAPLGVLAGEVAHVIGVLVLARLEIGRTAPGEPPRVLTA